MEGKFLLASTHCTLVVVHGQSDSIPDSIATCEALTLYFHLLFADSKSTRDRRTSVARECSSLDGRS